MTKKLLTFKQDLIYWLVIFGYLTLPILISVTAETETHLTKRIIYNLIAIFGLTLPFALLPKHHKWLIILYIPVYIIYWLNFCHISIFKSSLLYSSVQIALDSNLQETQEFVSNFGNNYCYFLFIFYTMAIILAYIFVSKKTFSPQRSPQLIFFCLIAMGFGISKGFHNPIYSRYQFLPYRVIFSTVNYYRDIRELVSLRQEHKIPNIQGLTSQNTSKQKETYIIVIGESANRNHLGYYGYDRATTPFSSSDITPFIFNHVRSPHASTLLSLRDSLTFANKSHVKDGLKKGSLINIFNQAGFKTFWISNQFSRGQHDNLTSILAHDAQDVKFINNDKSIIYITGRDSHYDEDILPFLQKALDDSAIKKTIFIHLAGSHTMYSYRFPEKFDVFQENNQNNFTREFDDYDNSIRYTDFVLAQIVKSIAKLKEPSFVLYFSDHGDDVRLEADSCHCHTATPQGQNNHMYEIPFLLWFNQPYRRTHQTLISEMPNYINRPFINHHLIHSLPTLAGLSFDLQDNTKNLFSKKFIPEQP